MIVAFLQKTTIMAQFVAALLVTVSALRFAVYGFRSALAATSATSQTEQLSRSPRSSTTPDPAPAASDESAPNGSEGEAVRMTLAITVGPPRSEVFVNGRRVGRTPYVGDVPCKHGRTVRIDIIPDTAPLMRYEKKCFAGNLRLARPPAAKINESGRSPL